MKLSAMTAAASTVLLATGASSAAVPAAGGQKCPKPVTTAYASRMAESWIKLNNEQQRAAWYGRAALYTGYEAVIARTGNDTLLDWYRTKMDGGIVNPDGSIIDWRPMHYSMDDYRIGHNMLYWYERTGEEKYKIAADTVRDMLKGHPQTPTGGFWHRDVVYPNQMWLDGIYMADTFYARYTKMFQPDNQTAWDHIVLQWDKIEEIARVPSTNLLVHGFDESKTAVWADPVTGAAPIVWNRAVGWYIWSLVEILDLFPQSHPGYARLMKYFTTLAEGLKRAQDPESHGWWLVMSDPYIGVEGNYLESSAAAMFTYGWLAGMKRGWISEEEFLGPATLAYSHMIQDFVTENADGTVTWEKTVEVGSLGSNATFEYYTGIPVVQHDTRGVGPFLLAAVEWEERNNIAS
ncbi:hypothetical protein MCOR02_005014 [Pyricularia oryzae]|uniref:Cell wall glycosyl hydrolase YteR n=1 Tax=Pyricularia oryzae TaxID=318829 RepID=A0A4P7MTQ4_PYROR|nr:hypothetical protein MCOR02_005014 [Pyricularia oryzae]KAI6305254.1 hypothetical protein MCOR34_008660 [Pyricularia oryzae]KAI6342526.1 hypothetical protein MCOR30_001770 [Pyricularia oryzae]KAI6357586.1 hypothetical protein MCOR31_010266 [Pyricularia oryzae]KAI6406027.1 hypothetical protein MCOR24_007750 [Pyricularia oryzae]